MVRIQNNLDRDTFQALQELVQAKKYVPANKGINRSGPKPNTKVGATSQVAALESVESKPRRGEEKPRPEKRSLPKQDANSSIAEARTHKCTSPVRTIAIHRLAAILMVEPKMILRFLSRNFHCSSDTYLIEFGEIREIEQYVASCAADISIEEFAKLLGTPIVYVRRICTSEEIPIRRNKAGFETVARSDWLLLLEVFSPVTDGRRAIWYKTFDVENGQKNDHAKTVTNTVSRFRARVSSVEDLTRDFRDLRAQFKRADRLASLRLKAPKQELLVRISRAMEAATSRDIAALRKLKRQVEALRYYIPRKATGRPVVSGGLPSLGSNRR